MTSSSSRISARVQSCDKTTHSAQQYMAVWFNLARQYVALYSTEEWFNLARQYVALYSTEEWFNLASSCGDAAWKTAKPSTVTCLKRKLPTYTTVNSLMEKLFNPFPPEGPASSLLANWLKIRLCVYLYNTRVSGDYTVY